MQFAMVFNLLTKNGKAQYLIRTLAKSIQGGRRFKSRVIASSKSSNYNYIPKDYVIDEEADYFHCFQ